MASSVLLDQKFAHSKDVKKFAFSVPELVIQMSAMLCLFSVALSLSPVLFLPLLFWWLISFLIRETIFHLFALNP